MHKSESKVAPAPAPEDEETESVKNYHCAYCFIEISLDKVKNCSRCHKRRYCSRACQSKDWKPKGSGQGHKLWCGLEMGEEDEEWEVKTQVGRGVIGIFALKDLPTDYRLFVDRIGPKGYPSQYPNGGSSPYEGRSALINHACDPNAYKLPMLSPSEGKGQGCDGAIIMTQAEIFEGDEIFVSYTMFNDTFANAPIKTAEESRNILLEKWGIVCPSDCTCKAPGIDKYLKEAKKMDSCLNHNLFHTGMSKLQDARIDLLIIPQLLDRADILKSSAVDKMRINKRGFKIAVQQKSTLHAARYYINNIVKFFSSAYPPNAEIRLRHEAYLADLSLHADYLKLDKEFGGGSRMANEEAQNEEAQKQNEDAQNQNEDDSTDKEEKLGF